MSERLLHNAHDAAPLPLPALARRAMAVGTRAYLRLYHRLHITGRERIPDRGPVLLVANHASHLDTVCLLAALPLARLEHAYAAAVDDYFAAGVPHLAMRALMIKGVPFARGPYRRSSLARCAALLADSDNVLVWFAEGTRTRTGELGAFRPGIGALAAGRPVAVVPCAVRGSFKAWPKGRALPLPRTLSVSIGRPMFFAHFPRERGSYEAIAERVHEAVRELLCT